MLAPGPDRLIGHVDTTLSISSCTSRKLNGNRWYSQTQWLMISGGNRNPLYDEPAAVTIVYLVPHRTFPAHQPDSAGLIANCVGGVISPLLCNVYLHRLDRGIGTSAAYGVLVRFADDALVMCKSRSRPRPRWRGCGSCWPSSAWNRRRPRPGSCIWGWAARELTSSVFITGWCA